MSLNDFPRLNPVVAEARLLEAPSFSRMALFIKTCSSQGIRVYEGVCFFVQASTLTALMYAIDAFTSIDYRRCTTPVSLRLSRSPATGMLW